MIAIVRLAFAALIAIPMLALTACGPRDTKQQVEKGNANIARMNAIKEELRTKHFFLLELPYTPESLKAAQMGKEYAEPVRALLAEYVALGDELSRIVQREDVVYERKAELTQSLANAKQSLAALDAHLAFLNANPDVARSFSQNSARLADEAFGRQPSAPSPPARPRPSPDRPARPGNH